MASENRPSNPDGSRPGNESLGREFDAALQAGSRDSGPTPPTIGDLHALLRSATTGGADRDARPTPAVPNLPRYEILGVLGEGATAVVYRARDTQLGRTVAVKVLRETASASPTARQRFRREAQTAGGINHPNVIQIHDAGETGGRLYLVMELVDGLPLAQVLKAKIDPRQVLQLLEQSCRGVGAAHAQGVVHRDLKPANILITSTGQPKVGDFGLAHLVESSAELTKTGATLGTPLYMSPEQAEGRNKDVTPPTDVYALGAILYETVTGAPPHTGQTLMEIYGKIARDEPVRPRKLAPRISADLETIILKAIDKDPRHRYATADLLADDLRRFLAGEPIAARPAPAAVRFVRGLRRRRALAASLLTGTAIALALILWAVSDARRRSDRAAGMLNRARASERTGNLGEARSAYEALLLEDPDNAEGKAGLDRMAAQLAAEKEASKLLEEARPGLESAFRSVYDPRTKAEDLDRQLDAVAARIDRAIRIAPRLAFAHYLLGRTWEVRGQAERAEPLTRKAIGLDPDFAPARYQLGRLLLARAYEETVGAAPEQLAARNSGLRARTEEAAREIEASLLRGKGLGDALHQEVARAMLAFAKGESAKALELARDGLARFADKEGREEFWWVSGLAASGTERRLAFDEALKIRPKWPLVLLARAAEHLAGGRTEEAIEDCEELLRLRPDDPYALVNRGIAWSHTGNLEGAVADFDQALLQRPSYPLAHYNRGLARYRRTDTAGAIEDFDETIRLLPGFAPAYDNRGNALAKLGRLDEALADFTTAIQAAPEQAGPYNNRGSVRFKKGDEAGAMSDFAEAVRIDPKFAEAFYNRALVRLRQENAPAAMEDLTRAVSLRSDWSAPLAMRARLRALRGDRAGAKNDALRAIELGVDPGEKTELERLIKSDE